MDEHEPAWEPALLHVGDVVRRYRREKGWSQQDVADAAKKADKSFARQLVGKFERKGYAGKRGTIQERRFFEAICVGLGLDPDQLRHMAAKQIRSDAQTIPNATKDDKNQVAVTGAPPTAHGKNGDENETARLVQSSSEVEMGEIEIMLSQMTPNQSALWRARALRLGGAILSGGNPQVVEAPQPDSQAEDST